MKDYHELYGKVENHLPSISREEVTSLTGSRQRYIWMVALPDDEILKAAWIMWIVVSLFSVLASAFVICSILSRVETRKKSVNIAVVFLAVPDLLFSAVCLVVCSLNLKNERFISKKICDLQQFFTVWGFTASIWMNFVCMYVGYELLSNTLSSRTLTGNVTIPTVIFRAVIVYTTSSFLSVWTFIPGIPLVSVPLGGAACVPVPYNIESEIFFWLVVANLIFILPTVLSLCLYVFRVRPLLRKSQRILQGGTDRNSTNIKASQEIMNFFIRIISIFVFMWAPTALLMWGLGFETSPAYFAAVMGGTWSHFQGVISACIYLSKPDIRKSAKMLIGHLPCCPSYEVVKNSAKSLSEHERRAINQNALESRSGQSDGDMRTYESIVVLS